MSLNKSVLSQKNNESQSQSVLKKSRELTNNYILMED